MSIVWVFFKKESQNSIINAIKINSTSSLLENICNEIDAKLIHVVQTVFSGELLIQNTVKKMQTIFMAGLKR